MGSAHPNSAHGTPSYLGLDFGTESVRVVVVGSRGEPLAAAVAEYPHGQIVPGSASAQRFFPAGLPSGFALQHPGDWLEAAARATREALARSGADTSHVAGIGVDFTSCTVLPCSEDGMPLCLDSIEGSLSRLAADPHAWPKLWKHHGAVAQTARLNVVARDRGETWLQRYGGIIGLEWFFPKGLELIESSPRSAEATAHWIEAGDWLVWMLLGAPALENGTGPALPPRSTCQAGYKGLWSADEGYPGDDYLAAVHPHLTEFKRVGTRGLLVPPGRRAGFLAAPMAARLGLPEGIAISAATIDAHAGLPGAGIYEPGALVMVMGTSGCHMLLAEREERVPGIAGVVKDGILPGYYGYETGQAAMGDAFDWVRRVTRTPFEELAPAAAAVPPGAGGVSAVDWFHGCRTPLMDGSLRGSFYGLGLETTPAEIFRATLEASAYGLRWIVDTLRDGGVPIERFVATGGLPRTSPLFLAIAAAVLETSVEVPGAEHGPALGAAILGAMAAGSEGGGFDDAAEAVATLAGQKSRHPAAESVPCRTEWQSSYRDGYARYRERVEQLRP